MAKIEVRSNEENIEAPLKFLKFTEFSKSLVKLEELINKHGTIFISMPDGPPLKLTRARVE